MRGFRSRSGMTWSISRSWSEWLDPPHRGRPGRLAGSPSPACRDVVFRGPVPGRGDRAGPFRGTGARARPRTGLAGDAADLHLGPGPPPQAAGGRGHLPDARVASGRRRRGRLPGRSARASGSPHRQRVPSRAHPQPGAQPECPQRPRRRAGHDARRGGHRLGPARDPRASGGHRRAGDRGARPRGQRAEVGPGAGCQAQAGRIPAAPRPAPDPARRRLAATAAGERFGGGWTLGRVRPDSRRAGGGRGPDRVQHPAGRVRGVHPRLSAPGGRPCGPGAAQRVVLRDR